MKNERSIFVYENWLYLHSAFQFALDPNLEYYQGAQHPINQQVLFYNSASEWR